MNSCGLGHGAKRPTTGYHPSYYCLEAHTCSMPVPDSQMMIQQSISPNDGALARPSDNGYVNRRSRGDEMERKGRDPRAPMPQRSSSMIQGGPPLMREMDDPCRRVRRESVREAQQKTLSYYQETATGKGIDMSMHTYFPAAIPKNGESQARPLPPPLPRRRPPPAIDAQSQEAIQRSLRERQNRNDMHQQIKQQQQQRSFRDRDRGSRSDPRGSPSDMDDSPPGPGPAPAPRAILDSALQRQLEKDEREKERRDRSRGVSGQQSTRSGESGRSRSSIGSRGERTRRSTSTPRRHENDSELDPPRRMRSNSVSRMLPDSPEQQDGSRHRRVRAESMSLPNRDTEGSRRSRTDPSIPKPPARSPSVPAMSKSRVAPSAPSSSRPRPPSGMASSRERQLSDSRLDLRGEASPPPRMKPHRKSHGDLVELDDDRLDRIDEFANDGSGDDPARRRSRQISNPAKKSSTHRSQRVIEGEPPPPRRRPSERPSNEEPPPRRRTSERPPDDRPRRKPSDAEIHERRRRKPSIDDEPPSRRRASNDGEPLERRRRSRSTDGEIKSSSRGHQRALSVKHSAEHLVDTFGSRSSPNPFTEAMAAILLDNPASAGFTTEKEMEQRIADIVWGKFQNSTMRADMERMAAGSDPAAVTFQPDAGDPASGPPQNVATIVLTDVQGSTSLWEANPQAMQEALDLHDKILRRFCAFHNGYEIDTEGDAFFLAFHTPMDAFGFALDTQSSLFDTEWSEEILKIPAASAQGCFRGLRVRMGIHQGPVTACKNEVTGRTEYVGEAMSIAKCVEGMTHGGQILTTFETWNAASYKAEADLGSPQVVDLGCHLLNPKGMDEPIERRIIQLVPASLSYDYFASRRLKNTEEGASSPVIPPSNGRQFDPPITDEQLSASFHDAPYKNNEVTIAFVYFSEIENQYEDPKPIIAALIRLIGDLLVGTPGYHSQSNMLAFPSVNEAVKFGLRLMEELRETRLTDDYADLSKMIKFGCVHDTFLTMGPHKTTGRADYFGKVVNRAARITAKSELGSVNFGVLADESIGKLPALDSNILCQLKGVKQLKGVQEDMAIYECSMDIRANAPLGLSG